MTLGATCCTMNGIDQRVLAAAGARRDLDALIQLGDTVYADGSKTLADYRARWADNLGQAGYQALRARWWCRCCRSSTRSRARSTPMTGAVTVGRCESCSAVSRRTSTSGRAPPPARRSG